MHNYNNSGPIKVLLVEDNAIDARLIKKIILKTDGNQFQINHVAALKPAFEFLKENEIDVILLDLSLPDSYSLDTYDSMYKAFPGIPIIVLTSMGDHRIAVETVQKGAQDYLVKGSLEGSILTRSISYAIERHKLREKLKEANQKLLDHQKLLIEEERLNVLLEMAGATAHELNQPLTVLLCKAELLPLIKDNPEKMENYLEAIIRAATKISSIVQKIQNIRSYDTKTYEGNTKIIDIDQK